LTTRGGFRALAGERGYLRFLSAATFARVADEMFSVGVVLLALERTGSATVAGFLVAAITLPSLITAPLLGAWLDLRGRRKALMMLDQALASAALVAIALLLGHVPDALLVAVAFLAGLTWPLSFGGFTSLIPAIVPDELLTRANAVEATSFNVAVIAGPLLAGAIAGIAGPQTAVVTEAGLTLFTLVLLVGFDALDSGPVRSAGSLMQVVRDGLRALVAVPELLGVSVAGALNLAGAGFLTVAFPYFCIDHLDAPRNASGALWAAFAFGSAVGALALVRLQRRYKPHNIVLMSMLVFGVLMLPWPLAESLPVALVLIAVASVADGPGLAATFAVRQGWAPRDLQGQIFTTAAGLKVGGFALGSAAAGPLVTAVGSTGALLAAAGDRPYTVAVGGSGRGDDWEAEREHIRSVAEAGAGWWIEWLPPRDPETMAEHVERGPLRID
jgi:MFS family permease